MWLLCDCYVKYEEAEGLTYFLYFLGYVNITKLLSLIDKYM